VDYAASLGEVCFLVRGIRNMTDMMQELNLADINQELSGFSTFFIPTSNEFRNVSSSFVKELFHHGKDISKYVPKEVIDVLKMVGE
jgi:pantetheine-phosphate adenylyltransferase